MSTIELVAVFIIGWIAGAYCCWLGRGWIEMGISLMKLEQKKVKEEEAAAANASQKNLQENNTPPQEPPQAS